MTIRFSNPTEEGTTQSAAPTQGTNAATSTPGSEQDSSAAPTQGTNAASTTPGSEQDSSAASTPQKKQPHTTQLYNEALSNLAMMRRKFEQEKAAKNQAYAFIIAAGLVDTYYEFTKELSDVEDWHAAAAALLLHSDPDPANQPLASVVRSAECELTPQEEHPQQTTLNPQAKSLLSLIDTSKKRKGILSDFCTLRENLEGLFIYKGSPLQGNKTHPLYRIMGTVNEMIGILLKNGDNLIKHPSPIGTIVEVK